MKLNNRGWGFRAMLFYMIVLIIFLFIAIALIIRMYRYEGKDVPISEPITNIIEKADGVITNNEIRLYSDLELKLKNATVSYLRNYYDKEITSERVSISLKALQGSGVIDDLKDVKDKTLCNGYTLVSYSKLTGMRYNPYIKCSGYTTTGYDEALAE